MDSTKRFFIIVLVACLTLAGRLCSYAQGLLDKTISVEVKKRPVSEALNAISKQGHFYFSYNSLIFKKDTLVSLSVRNKTVRQSLEMLLGENYEYKETGTHIVILPLEREKWYTISGYITDAQTGQKVPDASVFERQQLVAALSDNAGYFKLRLKDKERYAAPQITISKGFYVDTNVALDKGFDQEIILAITPAEHELPDIVITQYSHIEKSWIGRLFVSDKLRKQSINLGKFFVDEPVQVSLLPGLGSHGSMNSQVVNAVSFNVIGGYSAGVDGIELGGMFNIDKKDVQYVQVAGIFNVVAGSVKGLQVAGCVNVVTKSVNGLQASGIYSHISDSAKGLIVSGISSYIGRSMKGMQVSGIANLVGNRDSIATTMADTIETMHGMQAAGIVNVVNGNSKGFQVSGIANLNRGNFEGVQMSGIINTAKKVDGSQISIINISDTVSGYCFGILNIVKHGYHMLSISSTEMLGLNAVYKAGNRQLYSILGGGMSVGETKQIYAVQYGLGVEVPLSKKLGLAMELTSSHMYPSSQKDNISIVRFEPALKWQLHKLLSIYAGPAFAFCPDTQGVIKDYFPSGIPATAPYTFNPGGASVAWIGWRAGINLF